MNKDIRLSICFIDHPKVMKLERKLTFEGVKSLIRLWCFSAQNRPEGKLTGMDADDIEMAARWTGEPGLFISTISHESCLWVDIQDGVFVLHDWEEHQGYVVHAKERSQKAKDAANKRWEKMNTTSNATGMPQAMLGDAKSNAPSPDPVPEPIPSPKQKKEPKSKNFIPPSVDQVREYCLERGNTIDPQYFVDCNTGKGWKVGRTQTPMQDWRAVIRTWEKNSSSGSNGLKLVKDDTPAFDYNDPNAIRPDGMTNQEFWTKRDRIARINAGFC